MTCTRCARGCSGSGWCRVVDPAKGDQYPWQVAYMSIIRVEDLMLYHTCPGCLALRIVVPGATISCEECWWNEYSRPSTLALKRISVEDVVDRLERLKPSLLLIDGCEPLIHDWVIDLLRRVVEKTNILVGVKSCGLINPLRLRSIKDLVDVLVYEYIAAISSDSIRFLDNMARVLDEAINTMRVVEVVFYYTSDQRSKTMLNDLAKRYADRSSIVVVPTSDAAYSSAYRVVKELRSDGLHVYLHEDESYTLVDVVCSGCGSPLVRRRPWGVSVTAKRGEKGEAVCSKCGRRHSYIAICESRRPVTVHRELAVF